MHVRVSRMTNPSTLSASSCRDPRIGCARGCWEKGLRMARMHDMCKRASTAHMARRASPSLLRRQAKPGQGAGRSTTAMLPPALPTLSWSCTRKIIVRHHRPLPHTAQIPSQRAFANETLPWRPRGHLLRAHVGERSERPRARTRWCACCRMRPVRRHEVASSPLRGAPPGDAAPPRG